MSLLDQSNLIEINLYYKYVDADNGKKLVILDEKKGKEAFNSSIEDISKSVEILKTKWTVLNWKEQNEVMDLSFQMISPQTGERQFNFIGYRDAVIKRCLKEWDITSDKKPVPVTSDAIDSLPGPVVINLYQKFETLIDYTEQELGN